MTQLYKQIGVGNLDWISSWLFFVKYIVGVKKGSRALEEFLIPLVFSLILEKLISYRNKGQLKKLLGPERRICEGKNKQQKKVR